MLHLFVMSMDSMSPHPHIALTGLNDIKHEVKGKIAGGT